MVQEGTFRGCRVAVKQIYTLILSSHNRRLFEREMSIASRCRHPCLLQFIGATVDDGNPLLVMELMETSLRKRLEEQALSEAGLSREELLSLPPIQQELYMIQATERDTGNKLHQWLMMKSEI